MKKSILIGVLAALMLFAFTACDNTATTGFDQAVISITAEGTPEYFVGDEVSVSDYTVTATRFNGETFTVDPADLKLDAKALALVPSTGKSGDTVAAGTITYTGYTYPNVTPKAEVEAVAYVLESIVVEGPENVAYYGVPTITAANAEADETKGQFKVSDYTVTGYAKDEAYSRVLSYDDGDYTIKLGTATESNTKYPVEFTAGSIKNDADDNAIAITVLPDYVTDFTVALKKDAKVYIGETVASKTAATFVDVTATYMSGAVKTTDADTPSLTAGTDFTAAVDAKGLANFESTAVDITVSMVVGNSSTEATKKSVSITPSANAIKSFTVKYTSAGTASFEGGTVLNATNLVFADSNPVWEATGVTLTEAEQAIVDNATFKINGQSTYTLPVIEGTYPLTITMDGQTVTSTLVVTVANS